MNAKMTMKCISLLLCLVMFLGMLPMQAMAADMVASGTSGGATWTLDGDGLFTIAGGEMDNYASAEERPWHSYANQIKKVVIGSGVIRVGDYAFADCTNLTEVDVGSSVYTIGAYSFENTTSLTEVVMPKNVKVFCDGMFHNSGLKKLYVYSRYTEFEGFWSVGYDEDNVLPLDTVVYCYDCSHAYFYFNRPVVVLMDDLAMDVDNGDGNVEVNIEHPYYVRDLWSAAESQDALVLDSSIYINTDDAMRIHNEMVAEGYQIGPDYHNNGKLEVEVRIELRDQQENGITTIWGSAYYSFFEYSLEYELNEDYLKWDCWSNAEDIFTVTPGADGVTVDFNTNMQELEDYAGEPVSWVFVYVSVMGISHKYNYRYDYEYVDKTTTVESCGTSIYDAHLRESNIDWGEDRTGLLTLDYEFVVDDWAPYGGYMTEEEYAKYFEPVSRHYEWHYRIGREGYFYDEETGTDIYPGEGFWNIDEGMFTEEYNGVLYGGVAGNYDAGSDPSVSLREMLPAEQLAFVETLRGVEARGMGGEATIELWYTLTVTYADGFEMVLEGRTADETTSIAGICLHTCTVCGLCTSEELLACNSQYGWRTNQCTCENPQPAIEPSMVEDAQVIESYTWYGDVTARVETFDVEMAVTTDYFKMVTANLDGYDVVSVYDITLYNAYGDAIKINEWGGDEEYVTLSIPVSAEIAAAAAKGDLALYHVDANGNADLVAITVDTINNTITFTGTQFSPYVLVESVAAIEKGNWTMALDSVIYLNYYPTLNGFADDFDFGTRGGVIIWTGDEDALFAYKGAARDLMQIGKDNCQVIAGMQQNEKGEWYVQSNEIFAKNLGDTVYIRVFVEVNGEYVYGGVNYYSAANYCYDILNNREEREDTRNVCAALLQYAAAAQIYFDYKTDALVTNIPSNWPNIDLSQYNLAYNEDYIDALPTTSHVDQHIKDLAASLSGTRVSVTHLPDTLDLQGAIRLTVRYSMEKVNIDWSNVASAKVLFWNEDAMAELDALTVANANYISELVYDEVEGIYKAQSDHILAKNLGEVVYFSVRIEMNDGTVYRGGLNWYSPEAFVADSIAAESGAIEVCKAIAVYSEMARIRFAENAN